MNAAGKIYGCREQAAALFDCLPEQVVLTGNCTHGLNIAIRTLVKPGDRVLITGFEHNAVTRPLYALGAKPVVAGRKLFDPADTLACWEKALQQGVQAAVMTHVSNVFGYILPVEQMAALCRHYGVPFVVDAAQSAGYLPVYLQELGADFIAMPGHKGLLGPQGTGMLLCGTDPSPLLFGGTGSLSQQQQMPSFLPDRGEAGTLNVPGIAGLEMGMRYVNQMHWETVRKNQARQLRRCASELGKLGFAVYAGAPQLGTLSFVPTMDCETVAQALAQRGIAVRAGLHCAPLAHESAGTLETGTVRISFGHAPRDGQTDGLIRAVKALW
jgi:selenocysteine lyase/cysteine desulfurase